MSGMPITDSLRGRLRVVRLMRQLPEMPEFPIYRELGGVYVIYVAGERQTFICRESAELARLHARADWLRRQDEDG